MELAADRRLPAWPHRDRREAARCERRREPGQQRWRHADVHRLPQRPPGIVQLFSPPTAPAAPSRPSPPPGDTAEHFATDEDPPRPPRLPRPQRRRRRHAAPPPRGPHARARAREAAHRDTARAPRATAPTSWRTPPPRRATAVGVPPTPLDRAKELCMTGRAARGSAAHVVLEWGAPWSGRRTASARPRCARERRGTVLRPCALFSRKDPRMHEGYGATAMTRRLRGVAGEVRGGVGRVALK